MNYRRILRTLGVVLCFESVLMLVPLICAVIYKEKAAFAFLQSILVCLVFGLLCL